MFVQILHCLKQEFLGKLFLGTKDNSRNKENPKIDIGLNVLGIFSTLYATK